MRIRQILVPTDFSSCAEHAAKYAVDIAKRTGARLHLLHVYQLPVGIDGSQPIPPPEEYFDRLREQAQLQLRAAEEKVRAEGGTDVETYLRFDFPARAILELAESLPADLIVMGTRGLTGMKHVLLGSVAERIVRLAPCDVMTVKDLLP